jgi:hypothetical protein
MAVGNDQLRLLAAEEPALRLAETATDAPQLPERETD